MPPRRRSRYVLLVAAVMVIMLYRVFQNSEWGPTNNAGFKPNVPVTHDPGHGDHAHKEAAKPAAPAEKPPPAIEDDPKPKPKTPLPPPKNAVHLPTLKTTLEEHGVFGLPTAPVTTKVRWQDDDTATVVVTTQTLAPPTTTLKPHIPAGGIHAQNPPGNLDAEVAPPILSSTTTSVQHWVKFPEHFPVADEDLIPLPTGKPKPIPKVQYDFPPESEIAKEKREKRLQQIKSEMTRAWQGYRKYAWMHDELSPVSARFRDPFCGWAATLVDALDTLWIMGMKEEFDEAAKAVKNIDFTYSSVRRDIPVFETIIRYLGGLTAAYDISGADKGDYPMLLEKAVELAEILMGVFDTPNRMPILYYNWAPEYVSQPHRAGTVGVAELGTMSMEFTRLAQLTGNQRYYDAIARITNALEDLQSRGTALNGIFPENLDASGCNRTATQLAIQAASEEAQRQAAALESTSSPEGYVPPTATVAGTHEHASKETPVHGAAIKEPELRRGNGSEPSVHETHQTHAVHIARRAVRVNGNFSADRPTPKRSPFTATGQHSDWDCVEQGLTPSGYGFESYSMGGSQDSTYEYFSKEYLMLGGLEPKYKTMHIKTIEAVKKWLLYRPMVPGERDILFSAKASTNGHPEKDILRDYEVTHLTCFIGGMFGLGGKIFDRPDDVELAKKLADGCVWAYESTASGIMPEGSTVVPCQSMASCPWNETLWWEHLDPQAAWREKQILEWEQGELKRKEEAQFRAQQAEKEKLAAAEEAARKEEMAQKELAEQKAEMEIPRDKPRPQPPQRETGDYPREEPRNNSTYAADSAAHQHAKREPLPPPHVTDPRKETGEDEVVADLQSKLDLNGAGDTTVSPGSAYIGQTRMEDQMTQSGGVLSHVTIGDLPMSNKPQSHEEFVKNKIKDYKIPPGFVTISSRAYILRPEAIESVWYMYRITGDPTWQEKGWKMWEAIIKATRTEYGHSALDNTLDEKPLQVDGMESFWLAETLKYFYLLYSTPDVISLDDWVLNTEAHPFRRPK